MHFLLWFTLTAVRVLHSRTLRNNSARNASKTLALYSLFSALTSVLPFVQTAAMCTTCLGIALLQRTVLCIRIGQLLILRNRVLFANVDYDVGQGGGSRGLRVRRDHPRGYAHIRPKLCVNTLFTVPKHCKRRCAHGTSALSHIPLSLADFLSGGNFSSNFLCSP